MTSAQSIFARIAATAGNLRPGLVSAASVVTMVAAIGMQGGCAPTKNQSVGLSSVFREATSAIEKVKEFTGGYQQVYAHTTVGVRG